LESHYEGGFARAIYADDNLIGFTFFGFDDEIGQWEIARLMIALEYQGKGYGRAALHEIIKDMRQNPECQEIYISFLPDNATARHLYASIGFEDTGKIEDGEVIFRLPAKNGA
jgi:diamine N-acetyltransferase